MPRPQPDPDVVKAALELVAAGLSNREIAEGLEINEGTIRRWIKVYGPGAQSAPPAASVPVEEVVPPHMAPPPPPPPSTPLPSDPLELVRQLITEQHEALQRDRALGTRGAGSAAATLSRLVIALKQMEGDAAKRGGDIQITAAALAAADSELDTRLAALAERPTLCAHCGRALSVAWGTEGPATVADTAARPIIAKPSP